MKVCWFSTGISSFVACYLAEDVDEIIYAIREETGKITMNLMPVQNC